jgi:hypothetical protein
LNKPTQCSIFAEGFQGRDIPVPITAAMDRLFAKRSFPQSAREWFAMMLGDNGDIIQGRHGRRMYDLAGYSHEGSTTEFNRVLADLGAIVTAYFIANAPPPKTKRRRMDDYRFDPIRRTDGKWYFDIYELGTDKLVHTTEPRKSLDVARLDCRTWLKGEAPNNDNAVAGAQ